VFERRIPSTNGVAEILQVVTQEVEALM
jgi:hypothetical protein